MKGHIERSCEKQPTSAFRFGAGPCIVVATVAICMRLHHGHELSSRRLGHGARAAPLPLPLPDQLTL
eukprot:scaffold172901_cov26-Tisochrysis_lutea.AAC.3